VRFWRWEFHFALLRASGELRPIKFVKKLHKVHKKPEHALDVVTGDSGKDLGLDSGNSPLPFPATSLYLEVHTSESFCLF